MKNYDRINAHKPEEIENKKAYIVGGGIAGLTATAFLIEDGYMPGKNITILEQLPIVGGSMDGGGNARDGYVSRGERQLEPWMECLWYLYGKVPSLKDPTRTVLEETRECNQKVPIYSHYRLTENCFDKRDTSTLGLSKEDIKDMNRMILTPEEEIQNLKIDEWFKPKFFKSNLWYLWSSMFAFQAYHSLIELRRYTVRFIQHLSGIDHLQGILHTKYDQYHSLILPLTNWLESKGVNFITDVTVTDLDFTVGKSDKSVKTIYYDCKKGLKQINVGNGDLVFVTNGSMTQNTSRGSMTSAPVRNDDSEKRGCFTLWEQLAKKDPCFGKPVKFLAGNDKTFWISYTLTITDYPELFDYIEHTTGNKPGTGGVITMVDSAWFISINVPMQPLFPDQPKNVQVLWGYGLHSMEVGDYVNQPMFECTGEEIIKELLYHLRLQEKIEEIVPYCNCIPTTMPYITSQFMPRANGDRPHVLPLGYFNLAFIGQFVELPGDAVFTVETSVRTAMMAVYGLLKLDKPVIPLFTGQYDVRILMACMKKILGTNELTKDDLPIINPFKLPGIINKLLNGLNSVPEMKEDEINY